MSAEGYTAGIAAANSAHKELTAARNLHNVAQRRRSNEEQCLHDDEVKRARLIELEDEDQALRHLDGEDTVASKPQRTKTLATLADKIPRRKASIPLLKQREAEAASEAEAALAPFTAAIIEAVSLIQQPATEQIRAILAQLRQPLCDLVAADMIRLGTIGERFSIPAGHSAPFKGSVVVRKLVDSIPERLRPPELAFDRIETQASSIATAAILQIKDIR